MACNESLETLKQISRQLQTQNDALFGNSNSIVNNDYPGWTKTRTGKNVVYEQTVTYTGATITIDRPFNFGLAIKRIDQSWVAADGITPDATAKDIDIRIYSDVSSAVYSSLKYILANTDTSVQLSAQTEQELSFKPGSKIQFVYANNTSGKICKIVIIAEEL